MKKLILAVSALAILAACETTPQVETPINKDPVTIAKLQKVQPGATPDQVEATLGEAVSFNVAKDKKSHCKSYIYHDNATTADQYFIVQYLGNKVRAVSSGHLSPECDPTTSNPGDIAYEAPAEG